MVEVDFRQIVARCGGQREAFEDLCCQLAHRTIPEETPYTRLYGAGGDGGVECFADLASGRVGWQAKYVFSIDALLTQAEGSLTTALEIHPTLTRFVICFPFDLTGPTRRRGQSGQEKFDVWRTKLENEAASIGGQFKIEAWPAFRLRELLLEHDRSGGVREYFFNQTILTSNWFSDHLEHATSTAGPRYTPELNVKTPLWHWFEAFGRSADWCNQLIAKVQAFRRVHKRFLDALARAEHETSPNWPEGLRDDAELLASDTELLLARLECLQIVTKKDVYERCVSEVANLSARFSSLEGHLVKDLEAEHGKGTADSPGFRQYSAEYMVSFPAANIDLVRDLCGILRELYNWFCSPACSLAYERVFVLTGVAGAGKTHGVCDAADRRFKRNLLTCVTYGHEFRGEPDPWTRLAETLGLSVTLGMNGVLDTLDAAGEASGAPLILCIDAINETGQLRYWSDRLPAFAKAVQRRPRLRLCITCRTSYVSSCLPDSHDLAIVEHTGFAGLERLACQAFFTYYELEAPLAPILQPELANPLYLRLLCETLRSQGLRNLPLGWRGIAPTIRAFLEQKERKFAAEFDISPGARIVSRSLIAIARALVESGETLLPRSKAQQVMNSEPSALRVLEWLVREDLLLEDAPVATDPFLEEGLVRPAFERLGDFLVAAELLERCEKRGVYTACEPGGEFHWLVKDNDAVEHNKGLLAALSILVPEAYPERELPDLVGDQSVRVSVMQIAIQSFPSREPSSFTVESRLLLCEALALEGLFSAAMDAFLATCWQESAIDAIWLDNLLNKQTLAGRDAFWCGYLHRSYEEEGVVSRLIHAGFELPLDKLHREVAVRWLVALLWFTAAADRRVKDWSTRAATAILSAQPELIPDVLQRFIVCNDDEVRERTLLACYGALINSRDNDEVRIVTATLHEAYEREPKAFSNAMIRDDIRCIIELALHLNGSAEEFNPELTMEEGDSEWPLELPNKAQVKTWGELIHFEPNERHSDFFGYSMNCLRPWAQTFPRTRMGEWIVQRVARDFGYEGSGCERYDRYMLAKYGGGRAKPSWAERIGKKYQWVAMYQLASRLHDHIEGQRDECEPEPLQTPLILHQERKLDPTFPGNHSKEEGHPDSWWIRASADLDPKGKFSDEKWIARQEDLPALEEFLSIIEYEGQNWRVLVSYPKWRHGNEDAGWNDPYRYVWMHIEGYLVQQDEFTTAYNCLRGRNFFGGWMPEGATWLYGFMGEYPWATPFNTEPEEWHGRGGLGLRALPANYQASWNQLAVEWEYDASIKGNFHMLVPAREFFCLGDLWWDGKDGYRYINGKTVFRDPSVMETGPGSLIVDSDDLLQRLKKLGLRVIWTLLGEKIIVGGHNETAGQTFSQVAHLKDDGSLEIGKRVFFKDYEKDTGPSRKQ